MKKAERDLTIASDKTADNFRAALTKYLDSTECDLTPDTVSRLKSDLPSIDVFEEPGYSATFHGTCIGEEHYNIRKVREGTGSYKVSEDSYGNLHVTENTQKVTIYDTRPICEGYSGSVPFSVTKITSNHPVICKAYNRIQHGGYNCERILKTHWTDIKNTPAKRQLITFVYGKKEYTFFTVNDEPLVYYEFITANAEETAKTRGKLRVAFCLTNILLAGILIVLCLFSESNITAVVWTSIITAGLTVFEIFSLSPKGYLRLVKTATNTVVSKIPLLSILLEAVYIAAMIAVIIIATLNIV